VVESTARERRSTASDQVNVAQRLDRFAARAPERLAVRTALPGSRAEFDDVTFAEIAARSRRIASGLLASGLEPGARVCLFVRPGADLVACTYGLLRSGLVPVLIDPGMGRAALLACVAKVRPAALVGIARAHLAARLFPKSFESADLRVVVGGRASRGAVTLGAIEARGTDAFEGCDTRGSDQAAVLFTSGSTGPPKGVVYTHAIFDAQVRQLEALYGFRAGEVDVACFPLFALFDNALGMTSVFPDMDPSRPARCRPERIVDAIERSGATSAFASPAVWKRIVPFCETRGRGLGTLRRALTAGAPIPPALVERLVALLPDGGRAYTPYGATECLPVANVSDLEILDPAARSATNSGAGNLVGHLAPETCVRIARIQDGPVAAFDPSLELPRGEIGEVWARAEVATPGYQFDDVATAASKVPTDEPGPGPGYYHRMGDLGYLDETGRLWFCGRLGHRLRTRSGDVACVPIENLFAGHPQVLRCALVGVGPVGAQRPVLVVEPPRTSPVLPRSLERTRRPALERSILRYGLGRSPSAAIVKHVLFHPSFPVDPRHNAKIHREELRAWAERIQS
jgi:olefin beta-lactone synthetase